MARSKPGDPSFPRRKPRLKRGAGRPGIAYIPKREPETIPEPDEPLFGVFRNGRPVYLPPKDRLGVDLAEATRLSAALPGSYVKQVAGPEDAA